MHKFIWSTWLGFLIGSVILYATGIPSEVVTSSIVFTTAFAIVLSVNTLITGTKLK